MTNIGMTCLEELDEIDDVIGSGAASTAKKTSRKSSNKTNGSKKGNGTRKATAPTASKQQSTKATAPKANANASNNQQPKQEESKTNTNGDGDTSENRPTMSAAQKRAIQNLSRRRGISVDELEKMAADAYGVSLEFLSAQDASSFIRNLQQSA